MTQLCYHQLDLNTTEMGYTIASQDRYWTAFIFDIWSSEDGEDADLKGSRLFSQGLGEPWSYEMWDSELLWTTRREAEAFAQQVREQWTERIGGEAGEVYVINWGDDARYEAWVLGGRDGGGRVRQTPKFKGSERAIEAMREAHRRYWEGAS